MVSAKEYFQNKKNAVRQDEYQKEIQKHRRNRILIIVVIAVILFLAGFCFYLYNRGRVFDSHEIVLEQKREDAELTTYLKFNENIVKYNMDGIMCMDFEYKQIWNQAYEMKDPIVDICEQYLAVCDNSGNKIYIMNKDGLQGEVDSRFPIKKISVAGQGTVAVLMEEDGVNYIDYYDKEGNLIAENKAPVEKSGFPLAISMSNDGYKLAVSYMMIENAAIQTKLAFYNFDSVGENEIDHLVSAANYDGSIIPNIEFLTDDIAVAFGDSFFEIYEGTQKPKSIFKKEFSEEIKSVFYDENYIGFIFDSEEPNNLYEMQIYNLKGKLKTQQAYNMEYENIIIEKERIYIYNDSVCGIYNMNGKQIYEGSFEDTLESVIPISDRKWVAVFHNQLQQLRMK